MTKDKLTAEEKRKKRVEYNRQYRETHREQLREYTKKYTIANKERILEYQNRYYDSHKGAIRTKNRIERYTKFLNSLGYTVIPPEVEA